MLVFGRPLDLAELIAAYRRRSTQAAVGARGARASLSAPPTVTALGPIGAARAYDALADAALPAERGRGRCRSSFSASRASSAPCRRPSASPGGARCCARPSGATGGNGRELRGDSRALPRRRGSRPGRTDALTPRRLPPPPRALRRRLAQRPGLQLPAVPPRGRRAAGRHRPHQRAPRRRRERAASATGSASAMPARAT